MVMVRYHSKSFKQWLKLQIFRQAWRLVSLTRSRWIGADWQMLFDGRIDAIWHEWVLIRIDESMADRQQPHSLAAILNAATSAQSIWMRWEDQFTLSAVHYHSGTFSRHFSWQYIPAQFVESSTIQLRQHLLLSHHCSWGLSTDLRFAVRGSNHTPKPSSHSTDFPEVDGTRHNLVDF